MRKINEIILHCSATPEGKDYTVETIRQWHLKRNFNDIGYHYVIYRDGSVNDGRPIEKAGAHTTGHNSHSIGICYIGGCAKDGKTAKDTRTDEQKKALYELCRELIKKYNLKEGSVHGHYEFANKACPSFKVDEWIKEVDLFNFDKKEEEEKPADEPKQEEEKYTLTFKGHLAKDE